MAVGKESYSQQTRYSSPRIWMQSQIGLRRGDLIAGIFNDHGVVTDGVHLAKYVSCYRINGVSHGFF